jgi:DNA-binding transcriptional MerR regulator
LNIHIGVKVKCKLEHMRIGQLAERTGVSRRLLRCYEEQGLITPSRALNSYREYGESHVDVVLRLVEKLGFDAVDAGSLDESWRQQPGTPVYTTDLDVAGVRRALAAASPERTPEWRATPNSPGTFANPA